MFLFCALLAYGDYATRQPFPGQARVTLRIRTGEGKPTGLRLRVTNPAGDYYAPLGHLPAPDMSKRNSNDLILGDGQDTPLEVHALVYDGAEIDLPVGRYRFHATKGYEYEPVDQIFEVAKAERQTMPGFATWPATTQPTRSRKTRAGTTSASPRRPPAI